MHDVFNIATRKQVEVLRCSTGEEDGRSKGAYRFLFQVVRPAEESLEVLSIRAPPHGDIVETAKDKEDDESAGHHQSAVEHVQVRHDHKAQRRRGFGEQGDEISDEFSRSRQEIQQQVRRGLSQDQALGCSGSRVKDAQYYPPELCRAVAEGLKAQKMIAETGLCKLGFEKGH